MIPLKKLLERIETIQTIQEEDAVLLDFAAKINLLCAGDEVHWPRGMSSNIIRTERPLYRITKYRDKLTGNGSKDFRQPPINITLKNRCNLQYHPVFYAAEHPRVSLIEVLRDNKIDRTAFNSYYYLSEWTVSENKQLNALLILFSDKLDKDNEYKKASNPNKKTITQMLVSKGYTLDDAKVYFDLLHDAFVTEEKHNFSSVISHQFLYDDGGDIIVYPSVQAKGVSCNVAIHPRHIDTLIQLTKVYCFKIQEYDPHKGLVITYGPLGVNEYEFGKSKKGWRIPSVEENDFFMRFRTDENPLG